MIEYPWGGEFHIGNPESPVAVATMAERLDMPMDKVALWGKMMTENLGVEKVVANVIANPNIRFLILFGKEIRGHKSGGTLFALHKNGVGENNRIPDAPGAMPYIENLDDEAVTRFQEQIEIIDLLECEDTEELLNTIEKCSSRDPGSFGEPFIAIKLETKGAKMDGLDGNVAFYKDLSLDPLGKVTPLNNEEDP